MSAFVDLSSKKKDKNVKLYKSKATPKTGERPFDYH